MSFIVVPYVGELYESRNLDLVDKVALAESGSHYYRYVKLAKTVHYGIFR